MMRSLIYLALCIAFLGCNDDTSQYRVDGAPDASSVHDSHPLDGSTSGDLAWRDIAIVKDTNRPHGDFPGKRDGGSDGTATDTRVPDTTLDTLAPDATVDALAPDAVDTRAPDATVDTLAPPSGLSKPCQNGRGWTLFRFHYDSGSTSARIDVWDAACSYSFAPNSACNVREVYPGFGDVSRTSEGYPIFTTSQYLRVRFSVAGLQFQNAALYLRARSYATSSSTYFRAWAPLHGELEAGPVDNDWIYDWYGVDWSAFLSPNDDPPLTAIQIYASRGSAKLAVRAVEMCVW